MSLKTKFLVSVTVFMLLIIGLVTLNLLLDMHRRESVQRAALGLLITDWLHNNEALRRARHDAPLETWEEIGTQLRASRILSGWKIVGYPDAGPEVYSSQPLSPFIGAEEGEFLARARQLREPIVEQGTVYIAFSSYLGDSFAARFDLERNVTLPRETTREILEVMVLMAAATALILIVLYVLLSRFVLRPLDSLVEGARRVANGDFSRTVPDPTSYDEIHTLVEAFNSMMVKVQDYYRRMQEDVRKAREQVSQTQRKLLVAQRLSATGTLAAGVAHEINNPLGGMINAAKTIRDEPLEDAKKREYVDLIIDGLDRIRHIVGQILRMSPRPYRKSRVDIREAVRGAAALVEHKARNKGVTVALPEASEPLWVMADLGELQQAVLNVMMNAIDAVEPDQGRVDVDMARTAEGLRLTIRDNGCGMDDAQLAQCLDPFFTTKDVGEGTGMGLPMAHGIVLQHGGDMYIETRRGEGTSITFVLPPAEDVPEAESTTFEKESG